MFHNEQDRSVAVLGTSESYKVLLYSSDEDAKDPNPLAQKRTRLAGWFLVRNRRSSNGQHSIAPRVLDTQSCCAYGTQCYVLLCR